MESCGSCAGETLLRAGLSHELVVKVLEYLWAWPTDHEEEYDWKDQRARQRARNLFKLNRESSTPAVPVTFDGGHNLDGDDVYNNVCFKSPVDLSWSSRCSWFE